MKVVVFTSKKALAAKLDSLNRSRLFEFAVEDPSRLGKKPGGISEKRLYYLDSSHFSDKEIGKILRAYQGSEMVRIGIIDQSAIVPDPAQYFHQGVVDYIGKPLIQAGIDAQRIKKAVEYCSFSEETPTSTPIRPSFQEWILSGNTWKNVRSGQEYTFIIMFVEIDLIDEWKKKSGRDHLDEVKATFQKHIQQEISQIGGRIWMWMDMGGLILFPFDGQSCDPILAGLRFILNRTVISAEVYRYHTTISYRVALHIGNTMYKTRGNTGTIVSKSVNFLFHLGHQFAEPGNFYLTEPVTGFIPEGFRDCFTPAGTFEEMPISRMRVPVN